MDAERGLCRRLTALALAALLLPGIAVHLLVIEPATRSLALGALELNLTRSRAAAERHLHQLDSRLHAIREGARDGGPRLGDRAGFDTLVAPLRTTELPVSALHLTDSEGRAYSVRRDADGLRERGSTPSPDAIRSSPWFLAARSAGPDAGVGWTPAYRTTPDGKPVITAFIGLPQPEGGAHLLAVDIGLDDLSRLTLENTLGEGGGSLILDPRGEVLGLPRAPALPGLADRHAALLTPVTKLGPDYLALGYARWRATGSGERTLEFSNPDGDWLAQFMPLQLGGRQGWIAGFARRADFAPLRAWHMAAVLGLLTALCLALCHRGRRKPDGDPQLAADWSRRILESSPIAVVINHPGGPPLFANTRAAEIARTTMDEFMRRPAPSWFSSSSVAESVLVRLRDGQPIHDQEVEFRVADGSILWTLVTVEQIEFDGRPALIGWIYDITRRRAAEQELRKLSLAVEQSPSMLLITDPAGAIQYANPRYCRETGLPANVLAGHPPELVDAAGQPLDFLAGQATNLSAAGVWRGECQLRRRSGDPLWVGISVSGLSDDPNGTQAGITHCIWVLEDLSVHRQALQALHEAKRLAEEAAESKTRFLANMSHEIRTPLNAIIGLASLCLGTGLDARQRDFVGKIHASGSTLLGVVNDILDFSKIEAGKLRLERTPFTLDQVLDHVITFVAQKAAEKGLELLVELAPDVPQHLVGDPLRVGQVLTNLLGNAVKFTSRGEVRLRVGVAGRGEGQARLSFEVRDSGIGMDAGQIKRLFEAFSQADDSMTRRFGGTGLGLSIARNLVELMGGGAITVESQPDKGSCFRFVLPFEPGTGGLPAPLPPAASDPRVLVVDDHPAARRNMLQLLAGIPLRGEAVASAAEAIAALRQASQAERFGLVLMNLHLPLQDGIETTRRIKHDPGLAPPPAVILLTGYGDERAIGEALDAGADGHLHKPATASGLRAAIIAAFDAEPARPPCPAPASPPVQLDGLRLLLVEDNEVNQQIARVLLEKRGAQVTLADNGRIAVDTLRELGREAFDLVLMDLQMPVMDGLEATALIRQDRRFDTLPIIAMTAHALADQRQQCLDAGMNDHVAKPIVPELLFDAILRHAPPPSAASRPVQDGAAELPELPGLDVATALRRVGQEPATYLRLLRRFADTQADCARQIGAALEAGNAREAERLTHALRGSAANLGASALADAASRLETVLHNGGAATAHHHADHLADRLTGELASLLRMLEHTLPATEPEAPTAELDPAEFDAAVATLLALTQTADGRAPDVFRRLRSTLTARFGPACSAEIHDALQRYDYDRAVASLRQALDHGPAAPTSP